MLFQLLPIAALRSMASKVVSDSQYGELYKYIQVVLIEMDSVLHFLINWVLSHRHEQGYKSHN